MKYALVTVMMFLVCSVAAADGLVAGDAEAGKARVAICAACHGADGNSVNPAWPSLAGQHATYIVKQLQAFKKGERSNVLMSGPVATLTEQDMADLAVYFSAQTPAARAVADPDTLAAGESLYRGGNLEAGIPACMACHGPTGAGNPAASYPALSGQHAAYTAAQLAAYASGARKSDGPTKMMREIAEMLTEKQIAALSSYVQGLH